MLTEHSAGVVVCFLGDGKPKYLLLHYESGHWGFPKGHAEPGENDEQAAVRELAEETGIEHVFLLKGFKHDSMYYYTRIKETVHKTVAYFLAESPRKDVTLSPEHIGFRWLPFDAAKRQVTFPNDKDTLSKADEWIKTKRAIAGGSFSGHAALKREA